jgi:hypothetical protein
MADFASLGARLDATVWTGVGVLGVLVFLVGIYEPALAGLPYASILGIVVAVAGAVVAVLGFSLAAQQREAQRRGLARRAPPRVASQQQIVPSLEVYDPRIAVETPTEPPVLPPDGRP